MISNEEQAVCYLIAKRVDESGCIALRTSHGQHLVDLKRKLRKIIRDARIELITISRPSAYCEYEPYDFVCTEIELFKLVQEMSI